MHLNRTAYFFLHDNPLQFKVCAIFQLSIDCGNRPYFFCLFYILHPNISAAIIMQRILYGNAPPATSAILDDDDLEQALVLGEE